MDAPPTRGLAALAGPVGTNAPQQANLETPPEPPWDVAQQAAPPPPPSYKLYDSKRVTLATFLGSPLAGGWLMALNYRRVGQRRDFWTCIILTIVGTGAFVALGVLLPDNIPSSPIALCSIIGMGAIAKIQSEMIEQHKVRGGQLGSLWKAAGVGLVPLVLILGVVFAFVWVESNRYSKLTVSEGEEILYEGQATAGDAQKLGEWLQKARIFNGNGHKSVLLDKDSSGVTVSFVVSQTAANTPATIATFRGIGQQLQASGFASRVIIRFCDADLKLLREIK